MSHYCDTCGKDGHEWWDGQCAGPCLHCDEGALGHGTAKCGKGDRFGVYRPQPMTLAEENRAYHEKLMEALDNLARSRAYGQLLRETLEDGRAAKRAATLQQRTANKQDYDARKAFDKEHGAKPGSSKGNILKGASQAIATVGVNRFPGVHGKARKKLRKEANLLRLQDPQRSGRDSDTAGEDGVQNGEESAEAREDEVTVVKEVHNGEEQGREEEVQTEAEVREVQGGDVTMEDRSAETMQDGRFQ
ncbi:unnamed protein product [Zymoseptoria tritici ST99CH_3D1]|nr:unnamed protein product [Zymoseptoria tritici ST99CH_3D1]